MGCFWLKQATPAGFLLKAARGGRRTRSLIRYQGWKVLGKPTGQDSWLKSDDTQMTMNIQGPGLVERRVQRLQVGFGQGKGSAPPNRLHRGGAVTPQDSRPTGTKGGRASRKAGRLPDARGTQDGAERGSWRLHTSPTDFGLVPKARLSFLDSTAASTTKLRASRRVAPTG